ncbi:MAG: apolipoprotein N-acyltransferase [Pseudomonadota bacterium]|nr:apolipoprotein N-acyltransferase [Pseudomonadota bacterium]
MARRPAGPSRWPWRLASALCGAVCVAAFAPWFLWPLAPLCVAALFLIWRRAPIGRADAGFCFGMGLFTAGVHWIYISLHDHGDMPAALAAIALLGFAALNAGIPAAAGALSGWAGRRGRCAVGVDLLLLMPASFALLEWVRSWLLTGFPWLSLGYSQIPAAPLAGLAPLGGIWLCGLGVALAAGAVAIALLQRTMGPLLLLPLLWLPAWLTLHTHWTRPEGPPLTVSLLQGNVAQSLKFEPQHIRQALGDYLAMADASRARLIVMPESALALFRDELPDGYLERLRAIGARNHGDVLAGLFDETAPGVFQNTMISLGSSAPQAYRKHHLVPFGEFVPLKPLVKPVMDMVLDMPVGDQGAAPRGQPPMAVAGQQVGMDICYEDAFGDEIIEALPKATLLVNVSDDAWFGSAVGPEQHLQIAQARALEGGRAMARATNTGVTALIDADGRVLARAPKSARVHLDGELQGRSGATPYVRVGDLPAALLCLLLLAIGTLRSRRHRPWSGTRARS